MKTIRTLFLALLALCTLPQAASAQIGYQIALLNSATGEPRAAETVNVTLTLTDSENKVIYTGTQRATTNEFGVLSLTVGDENTFKQADWNKLPFFISTSVDGVVIGKSQLLTVPVAEYAKTAGPVLTKEMLAGTWGWNATIQFSSEDAPVYQNASYTFKQDGTCTFSVSSASEKLTYDIVGNHIIIYGPHTRAPHILASNSNYCIRDVLTYISQKDILIQDDPYGNFYDLPFIRQ